MFFGDCKACFQTVVKKNYLLSKKDLKVLEDRINIFFRCWNWNWMIAAQRSIKLWWLHDISVEELDIDLFLVLSERSVTRNSFKMLADVCSCSPVSLYSSSVQDRHYQSWSAICQVRRKIWKAVWRKSCDTKYASSLPLKGTCHWLWTSTWILVFQLWTFQWNSWYNAGEWRQN